MNNHNWCEICEIKTIENLKIKLYNQRILESVCEEINNKFRYITHILLRSIGVSDSELIRMIMKKLNYKEIFLVNFKNLFDIQ